MKTPRPAELAPHQLPIVSIDTHFANVPHIEEVRFDSARCATLFTHPEIRIHPDDLSRVHVRIRPDYNLGYTAKERKEIRKAHPSDYTDAASTELLTTDCQWGRFGDVLMTIVYGADFDPNKLLCHEAVHARYLLREGIFRKLGAPRWPSFLTLEWSERQEAAEEVEADKAMKNVALKGLRKNVIEVVKNKKRGRNKPIH